MGALAAAHTEKQWNKNVARLMYDTLYDELGGLTLTEFNYRYRSGEKVAQLFEKIAERLTPGNALTS